MYTCMYMYIPALSCYYYSMFIIVVVVVVTAFPGTRGVDATVAEIPLRIALHSAKGGAVQTGCSGLHYIIY